MPTKQTTKQQTQNILETHGGKTATKTQEMLLQDPALKELKPQIEFIQKNWRDPLRPAMIKLACQAVEGKPEQTEEAATAMSLINLSFYLWDDIIDNTQTRTFKPTTYGKYGQNQTIILAGIITAKAYTILNQAQLNHTKHKTITDLLWKMWTKIATAETSNLKAKTETYTAKNKLTKIETEAQANLETCLRIGALIGNASKKESKHLAKYGYNIGIILDLQTDTTVTLNLTLELTQKIATQNYPYTLLLAKEHTPEIQKILKKITNSNPANPNDIKKLLKEIAATKAIDEIEQKIKTLSTDSVEELNKINKNSAVQALQEFAKGQPLVFKENLQV